MKDIDEARRQYTQLQEVAGKLTEALLAITEDPDGMPDQAAVKLVNSILQSGTRFRFRLAW